MNKPHYDLILGNLTILQMTIPWLLLWAVDVKWNTLTPFEKSSLLLLIVIYTHLVFDRRSNETT